MNQKWIGFGGILVGMLASTMMQTLVAISMPVIEHDLGGMNLYSWVFGGYMFAATISIPLFAYLADNLGRRHLYIIGLLIFLVGSALVGLSQNMGQLVVFRVVQGIGAGAVAPAALASIGDLFDENLRGKIFGLMGAVQVLANLIGPPLGGWITDAFSWRWSFYLVLPIGILAIMLALFGLQDSHDSKHWHKVDLDWTGVGLITMGLCQGLLGIQWIGLATTQRIYGLLFCLSAILILGFSVHWQQKQREPIIAIKLLCDPIMWRATLGTLLMSFVMNGAIVYFPLYLEKVHHQTASATGLALLPMLLMTGISSGMGSMLAHRWPHQTQAIAWVFMVAGFSLLALMASRQIEWMGAMIGTGIGLLLPIYLKSAQHTGGASYLATSSGLIQMARNMGGAMGIPLLGIWLTTDLANKSVFTSIFATLAFIGLLGFLLGFSSSRKNSLTEKSLSIQQQEHI